MLPATNRRVEQHTCDAINRSIAEQTRERVIRLSKQSPAALTRRLDELDHEWDVERALESNASALAFSGIVLGATVDRKWLLFSGLVTGFLFQHATQGWCPPLPILRRLGFRTTAEINDERYALKAIRGDFDTLLNRRPTQPGAAEALEASRH